MTPSPVIMSTFIQTYYTRVFISVISECLFVQRRPDPTCIPFKHSHCGLIYPFAVPGRPVITMVILQIDCKESDGGPIILLASILVKSEAEVICT